MATAGTGWPGAATKLPCATGTHSTVRWTMRRCRWTVRGTWRCATWRGLVVRGVGLICLVCLTLVGLARGCSAMCTAPPASRTVPAAVADSFARAIFTDMGLSLVSLDGENLPAGPAGTCPCDPRKRHATPADN